jgi:hypothetical protein
MNVAEKTVNKSSIVETTVFLRISYGIPGNTRRVSSSQVDVKSNEDALPNVDFEALSEDEKTIAKEKAKRMLKVSKELLESPELEAIKKADGIMRTYIYKQCLPYTDMGVMILPLGQDGWFAQSVNDRLEAYADERKELVSACVANYPERIKDAEKQLSPLGLFNQSDYLSKEEFAAKFSFSWRMFSFAVPENLKKIGKFAEESAKLEETFKVAATEITVLMRESLHGLMSHLKDVLTPTEDGKKKRIFDSAVTNIQEFLDTFSARNITNDEELNTLVEQAKALINPGVYADKLRKDDSFRADILAGVDNLSSDLAKLVEIVPGRKFRDE